MGQELTQPAPKSNLPAKAVDLSPQYPSSGTMIQIQKGDVFAGAGEQRASKAQTEILCASIDPKDVRILPDTASLYLPWSWYADRLTKAFGPMGWSLLPITDEANNPRPPVMKDNVLYREFILRAEGRFVASAVGECAYNANNQRMTFGDAVEGARSNALSRCCKGLGMASEIHNDTWREEWVKANAVCVYVDQVKGRKQYWRRRNSIALKGEIGHSHPPCPCETCANGKPTAAPDGKPVIQSPTKTIEGTAEVKGAAPSSEPAIYHVVAIEQKKDAKGILWDIAVSGAKGVIAGYTRDPEQANVASSAKSKKTPITVQIVTRGKWTEFKAISPLVEKEGHA